MRTEVLPEQEFHSIGQLMARLGKSRSWIWSQLRADDGFPRPVYMGSHLAWHRKEVDAYIANLKPLKLTGVSCVKLKDGKSGRPRKAVAA